MTAIYFGCICWPVTFTYISPIQCQSNLPSLCNLKIRNHYIYLQLLEFREYFESKPIKHVDSKVKKTAVCKKISRQRFLFENICRSWKSTVDLPLLVMLMINHNHDERDDDDDDENDCLAKPYHPLHTWFSAPNWPLVQQWPWFGMAWYGLVLPGMVWYASNNGRSTREGIAHPPAHHSRYN